MQLRHDLQRLQLGPRFKGLEFQRFQKHESPSLGVYLIRIRVCSLGSASLCKPPPFEKLDYGLQVSFDPEPFKPQVAKVLKTRTPLSLSHSIFPEAFRGFSSLKLAESELIDLRDAW